MISPHHVATETACLKQRFPNEISHVQGMKRVSVHLDRYRPICLNTEANVCNEAAIFAARRSAEKVEMQDFERVPWRKFCHHLVVSTFVFPLNTRILLEGFQFEY